MSIRMVRCILDKAAMGMIIPERALKTIQKASMNLLVLFLYKPKTQLCYQSGQEAQAQE